MSRIRVTIYTYPIHALLGASTFGIAFKNRAIRVLNNGSACGMERTRNVLKAFIQAGGILLIQPDARTRRGERIAGVNARTASYDRCYHKEDHICLLRL